MKRNAPWLIFALAAIAAFVLFGQNSKKSDKTSVTVGEAFEMVKDTNVVVLDVRTEGEFNGELGHVEHALLIPVQELEQRVGELEPLKDKTILAICRTGRRSGTATGILKAKGFTAINVEGGMVRWNEQRLPVQKESQ